MSTASGTPPRRGSRLFTCLVKGPLGCLAFVVGAAAVLVLLLPPAGGRLADHLAEKWFAERHLGSLELGDAWVGSFYGPQRIDSVILRDPEGEEVLRAALRAPSFSEFHDGDAGLAGRYGPVEIRIVSLRLERDARGSTNLARALSPRVRDESASERSGGLSSDRPLELALVVTLERLRYADGLGRERTLDGIVLRGTLLWGPDETRLTLEGGSDPAPGESAHARLEFSRREGTRPGPWRSALTLDGLPSALAGLLVAAFEPLAPLAGERVDQLAWQEADERGALRVVDGPASLELQGILEGPGMLAEGALELGLDCAAGNEFLARLVPILSAIECEDGSARHELRLLRARWPLARDYGALSGELVLVPARGRARLVPGVAALLASTPPAEVHLDGARLELELRDGVLAYAPLRLPLADGWLELAGTLALTSGALDLRLTGERAGQPFDLGRRVGTPAALAPAPEAPPAPQEESPPESPPESPSEAAPEATRPGTPQPSAPEVPRDG